MAGVWAGYQIGLNLDQSLIPAMADEARWMISNGLTDARQIPDFLNYVYRDGLESVHPSGVRWIFLKPDNDLLLSTFLSPSLLKCAIRRGMGWNNGSRFRCKHRCSIDY